MITQVSDDLEGFDFSILKTLERFRNRIKPENGEIWFIPAPYPVPREKEVLRAITQDLGDGYFGERPRNKSELQSEYFDSLDYLLNEEGEANAYVFVPPSLLEVEYYGRELHPPRTYGAGLKNETRSLIGKESVDQADIGKECNSIGEFLTILLISSVLETRVESDQLREVPQRDDLYVEFSKLSNDEKLTQYFLRYLEVKPQSAYWEISPKGQKRVYNYQCYQTYGFDNNKANEWLETIRSLSQQERKWFRGLGVLYLGTRPADRSDISLDPIIPPIDRDREMVEDLRDTFDNFPDRPVKFKMGDLEKVSEYLSNHLGYLFLEPNENLLILPERNLLEKHLSIPIKKFENYAERYGSNTQGFDELIDILCVFFERMLEIGLFTSFTTVDKALQSEYNGLDLDALLKDVLEKANESQRSRLREYDDLSAIRRAFYTLESSDEIRSTVEEVEALSRSPENIPKFISMWCDHIREQNRSEYVSEAYVNAYDEFSDTIVESYQEIVEGKQDVDHISELVKNQKSSEIIFIIDSFGLTDLEFIGNSINSNPDRCTSVISNIPSYTPSAMSTIYTGLAPSSTGIYGWNPKRGDERYDLMKGRSDITSFITQTRQMEFDLVLSQKYTNSQITNFCSEISDITTHGITFSGLDAAVDSFAEEISKLANDSSRPKERPIVCYLQRFDSMLHEERDELRFDSYYVDLASFIDELVFRFRDAVRNSRIEHTDVLFTGDHGALTRRERELILEYLPSSFSDRFLENNIGEGLDEIFSDIESGSKFRFGWTDFDTAELNFKLDDIDGLDIHIPQGTGTFDLPDIGIVSRYDFTQTRRKSHGHHGGTSLSEMVVPKLVYEDIQNG